MKRIVSIQDLSCIGKCSQSIALPVLSAMGIECAALPTALLSAHTAFDAFVRCDLTDQLAPIAAHWASCGIGFDAIYTGYLASREQITLVQELIAQFAAENTLIFVDPVMADHGRLYAGFTPDFPEAMQALCRHADIITPNVTEACLLTNTPYCEHPSLQAIRILSQKLLQLGPRAVIITGIRSDQTHIGVAMMDQAGNFSLHQADYYPAVFHGTGDLFASTCIGALTLGFSAEKAVKIAADYVLKTVRVTAADPDARWYGVNFEETLPDLMASVGRFCKAEVET